ncbi:MAG: amidase [Ectothiorhodospiraceae bacterium]|nr:amidase [Ectothiorhodospiraceae bacterium]
MPTPELCLKTATELATLITSRAVSCTEVMAAHLAQIERVDGAINAIVTRLPEQAMAAARAADAALSRGEAVGPLHGLPVAIKDNLATRGVRTTSGSPLLADHVPEVDSLVWERLRGAGAIMVGKSNMPEFGAGSHTFNPVFGLTRNPYDPSRSAGGSSGGSGAALAARMVPIAQGGDTGGSLRNPGNFNNVVGFRPSPGRVPTWPVPLGWSPISVPGPMARTVEDTVLMLRAMAGPDDRCPIAIDEPGSVLAAPLARDFRGVRVAWSKDLGIYPVDPAVTRVLESQRHVFDDLGCVVEEAHPDFSTADALYTVIRAWIFAAAHGERIRTHRDQVKDAIVWNTEEGLKLSGRDVSRAEEMRTALYHRVREFLRTYEFLLLPVNQVPPFDADIEYPTEIAGVRMRHYFDWMGTCGAITVTGLPAVSVPCGFTDDGLPVGLQIVGRHHRDLDVLRLAHAFEQATRTWERLPPTIT